MVRISILVMSMMLSVHASADLSHRAGLQVGGIYLFMGFGVSLGAIYQLAFLRNFALEIDGKYDFGVMALGQGPTYSGGLDVSLQAMLYNFGDTNFSKGFGVGLGTGLHYLTDFNQNLFMDKNGDQMRVKKGTFLLFPLKIDLFYQHTFDNKWFIKTGFNGYVTQLIRQLEGQKIDSKSAARILPSVYFDFGYSF